MVTKKILIHLFFNVLLVFLLLFSACGGGSGSAGGKEQGETDPGTTEPGSENPGTTAPGGTVTKSSNADLSEITLSAGSLSPEFSADVTEYTVNVPYSVKKIDIDVQPADANAAATVAPQSPAILAVGDNSVVITVTAENGSEKQYNIKIIRAEFTAYTISFDKNNDSVPGNVSGTMYDFSVTDAPLVIPSCDFELTGYFFKGWATSPDGEVVYANNALCPVAENDLTLYAVWTESESGAPGTAAEFLEYFEVNGEITITEYSGSDTEVTIPATINGKPVTAIYSHQDYHTGVFYDNDTITSISIPDTVQTIGDSAFEGCSSLTRVDLPDSLLSIGDSAFRSCKSLTQIDLPDSLVSIDDNAFFGCNLLTQIDLPGSLGVIGNYAFYGCSSLTSLELPDLLLSIGDEAFFWCYNLKTLQIPKSVTTIGENPFILCSALTEITVHLENEYFSSQNGVLLTRDAKKIIAYPAGKSDTSYTCPVTVTNIGNYAFMDCEALTQIDLPNSLSEIGYYAFCGCSSLKTINLTDSLLTSIEDSTFQRCRSLDVVNLPASLTNIGSSVFAFCTSLTQINLPNSLDEIGNRAFESCGLLETIDLPASLTYIGSDAFRGCSKLASVTINASTPPTLGSGAFYNCPIANIAVPTGSVNAYNGADGWKNYNIVNQ